MSRILGIDYGQKRIGLALSDPTKLFAKPFMTIINKSQLQVLDELKRIIGEKEVESVVVGFPIGMKGQMTEQTKVVEKFVGILKELLSIPVDVIDERLTSWEANRVLHEQGIKPSKHKHLVDETAAAILLQSYLDRDR